ncbi:MAG: OmpA family protein [Bacteroidetes bacterium]|nr:OmpA family protein [Fibrella sp.]
MKPISILNGMILGLLSVAVIAQPGLKGEYFAGTNFEKKVVTRVDSQNFFGWTKHSPAPGVGPSKFSVRWTGKLLAPATGNYIFSATVDDGARVWVDDKKVIDAWPLLLDDVKSRREIVLEAGNYYDFRVEYFNDTLESFIVLVWQRPDDPKIINKEGKLVRDSRVSPVIDARYLFQKVPIAATPAKPRPAVVVVAAPSVTPPPAATLTAPEKKPVAETFGTLETGKSLVLENVFFEQSKPVLLPESYAELDKLVRTLHQNPTVRIEIAGHTDNVGDPRLNQSLSEYRARVVMNYLLRHGIADTRVEAKGYGDSRPLTANTTETERARNRRVAFVVK